MPKIVVEVFPGRSFENLYEGSKPPWSRAGFTWAAKIEYSTTQMPGIIARLSIFCRDDESDLRRKVLAEFLVRSVRNWMPGPPELWGGIKEKLREAFEDYSAEAGCSFPDTFYPGEIDWAGFDE